MFATTFLLASIAASAQVPSDDTLVDQVLATMAQCPPAATAVAGWQLTPVGAQGCATYVPPGWQVSNSTILFEANNDASKTAGYLWWMGHLPGLHWTVDAMSQHLVDEVRKGTPDLRVVRTYEEADPWGLGLQVKAMFVRFQRAGQEEIGSIRVMHTGCSPILGSCPFIATLSWEPISQIGALTCPLVVMDGALSCPKDGSPSCQDPTCRQACQSQGYRDGACAGEECRCRP